MDADNIPEDIEKFLRKSFDSVAQWEGLLLLQGRPDKIWNAEEVARNLYITEAEAADLLTDLEARAMVRIVQAQPPMFYRYQPREEEMDALIKRAAEHYKRSVIPITNLIHYCVAR